MEILYPTPNTFQLNTRVPNATIHPGVLGITINSIINSPVKFPFRKLEIKRRQSSDSLYEPNWQDITKYVTRWGTYETSIDDQRINQFVHSGFTFSVKNDYGEFNPEYDGASLFFGYFTRYRTLVRLSAGYTDGSGNQYPSDPVQGIFIMSGEIDIAPANKEVQINCKSIVSPFQEARIVEVPNLGSTMTSSDFMSKIRDATDGSNNYLFRTFITSTSWSIQTTTTYMNLASSSAFTGDLSVWEFMNKLAEIEGFVIYATRSGGITFSDRLPNQESPVFSLNGDGWRDPNIIKINSFKEATNKLFTHIRFKYSEADTETSFLEAGTSTSIDPRSIEWKYGRRTYEIENELFQNTATAQAQIEHVIGEFSNLRNELNLDCVFMPHIEVLDMVDVNHNETSNTSLYNWDQYFWAADTTTSDVSNVLFWASETSASILFRQKRFKVLSRRTNLDQFVTTFNLREVENA